MDEIDVAIVGAGPNGVAVAAQLEASGGSEAATDSFQVCEPSVTVADEIHLNLVMAGQPAESRARRRLSR